MIIMLCHMLFLTADALTVNNFQVHNLQLVLPSSSCSTFFKILCQGSSICRFPRFFLILLCGPLKRQNPLDVFFFLLIITSSGLLTGISWYVCISKSQRIVCVSFSRIDYGLCKYDLVVWSNFNLLHNSLWLLLLSLL